MAGPEKLYTIDDLDEIFPARPEDVDLRWGDRWLGRFRDADAYDRLDREAYSRDLGREIEEGRGRAVMSAGDFEEKRSDLARQQDALQDDLRRQQAILADGSLPKDDHTAAEARARQLKTEIEVKEREILSLRERYSSALEAEAQPARDIVSQREAELQRRSDDALQAAVREEERRNMRSERLRRLGRYAKGGAAGAAAMGTGAAALAILNNRSASEAREFTDLMSRFMDGEALPLSDLRYLSDTVGEDQFRRLAEAAKRARAEGRPVGQPVRDGVNEIIDDEEVDRLEEGTGFNPLEMYRRFMGSGRDAGSTPAPSSDPQIELPPPAPDLDGDNLFDWSPLEGAPLGDETLNDAPLDPASFSDDDLGNLLINVGFNPIDSPINRPAAVAAPPSPARQTAEAFTPLDVPTLPSTFSADEYYALLEENPPLAEEYLADRIMADAGRDIDERYSTGIENILGQMGMGEEGLGIVRRLGDAYANGYDGQIYPDDHLEENPYADGVASYLYSIPADVSGLVDAATAGQARPIVREALGAMGIEPLRRPAPAGTMEKSPGDRLRDLEDMARFNREEALSAGVSSTGTSGIPIYSFTDLLDMSPDERADAYDSGMVPENYRRVMDSAPPDRIRAAIGAGRLNDRSSSFADADEMLRAVSSGVRVDGAGDDGYQPTPRMPRDVDLPDMAEMRTPYVPPDLDEDDMAWLPGVLPGPTEAELAAAGIGAGVGGIGTRIVLDRTGRLLNRGLPRGLRDRARVATRPARTAATAGGAWLGALQGADAAESGDLDLDIGNMLSADNLLSEGLEMGVDPGLDTAVAVGSGLAAGAGTSAIMDRIGRLARGRIPGGRPLSIMTSATVGSGAGLAAGDVTGEIFDEDDGNTGVGGAQEEVDRVVEDILSSDETITPRGQIKPQPSEVEDEGPEAEPYEAFGYEPPSPPPSAPRAAPVERSAQLGFGNLLGSPASAATLEGEGGMAGGPAPYGPGIPRPSQEEMAAADRLGFNLVSSADAGVLDWATDAWMRATDLDVPDEDGVFPGDPPPEALPETQTAAASRGGSPGGATPRGASSSGGGRSAQPRPSGGSGLADVQMAAASGGSQGGAATWFQSLDPGTQQSIARALISFGAGMLQTDGDFGQMLGAGLKAGLAEIDETDGIQMRQAAQARRAARQAGGEDGGMIQSAPAEPTSPWDSLPQTEDMRRVREIERAVMAGNPGMSRTDAYNRGLAAVYDLRGLPA